MGSQAPCMVKLNLKYAKKERSHWELALVRVCWGVVLSEEKAQWNSCMLRPKRFSERVIYSLSNYVLKLLD